MYKQHEQAVFIVDDDSAVRKWLSSLMGSLDINAELFPSALEFLEVITPDHAGCLISDIRMPGLDGLGLQQQLKQIEVELPIIFITGYADVPMAVMAIKRGAFEFLEKPIREQALLEVVYEALAWDKEARRKKVDRLAIQTRLTQLTPREQEVLSLVTDGEPNKNIAQRLAISEKTVEIHRARIMTKLEVKSVAKLVQAVIHAREGRTGS